MSNRILAKATTDFYNFPMVASSAGFVAPFDVATKRYKGIESTQGYNSFQPLFPLRTGPTNRVKLSWESNISDIPNSSRFQLESSTYENQTHVITGYIIDNDQLLNFRGGIGVWITKLNVLYL